MVPNASAFCIDGPLGFPPFWPIQNFVQTLWKVVNSAVGVNDSNLEWFENQTSSKVLFEGLKAVRDGLLEVLLGVRDARRPVLRLCCGDQAGPTDQAYDPSDVVGERGQVELAANVLDPAHQERACLIHCLMVAKGYSTLFRRCTASAAYVCGIDRNVRFREGDVRRVYLCFQFDRQRQARPISQREA